ncbi:putative anthocyanidin 3-O-glucosyltransferase 2-like [Capsicum annuum]|nr:putative anthocyanidin 3-O-glucosyltransferase 2-like [Capsicum annuum]
MTTSESTSTELLHAQAQIWNYIFDFISSLAVRCALQLGSPDVLYKHASRLLAKNEPFNLRSILLLNHDPVLSKAWSELGAWFQNDSPTAFHTTHGKSFWDYIGKEQHKVLSDTFNDALASDSRFTKLYLLRNKDDAFNAFVSYKSEVENQLSRKIKRIRSDRGGEYVSLNGFCEKEGIIHEVTPPYSPESNGVAERKNKTLKEMMNSMLISSCAPDNLWGEAILSACHLQNRKRKIGSKTADCMLIGYVEHSAAYRFLVLKSDVLDVNTLIEIKNAEFFEHIFSLCDKISHAPVERENKSTSNIEELRRSKRPRKEYFSYGNDFQTFLVDNEPLNYFEAVSSSDAKFWKEVIKIELDTIVKNNTWVLTSLPSGAKSIGCKWIFKKKLNADGSLDKYKARLVAKGFSQKQNVDYFDTFAPVTRIASIRILIALTSIHKLFIHQMDVKKAFLNGDLEEEIYMIQPEGCVISGEENKVCKLTKSLYGLKQAPKQWHEKFDQVFIKDGFSSIEDDLLPHSSLNKDDLLPDIPLKKDDLFSNIPLKKDRLLSNIPLKRNDLMPPMYIHCDCQAAIAIVKNKSYSCKSRHMKLRHDVIKQLLRDGIISIDFVKSELNSADSLTKSVGRKLIPQTSKEMGLRPI